LEITSKDATTLTLSGAPSKSIAEIRMQNTMNGTTEVVIVDVNAIGLAVFEKPRNFGQQTSISARLLTEDNKDVLHEFVIKLSGSDFSYVTPGSVQVGPISAVVETDTN
jgi:hypothetical protein